MEPRGQIVGVATPDVVVVDGVSKRFTMRKDNSLKERIVTLGTRGRAHMQTFEAVKDVSFSIPAGSSIGLMGQNGSGKSTLLKLIGGIIDPTSGEVRRRGRLAALLELGAGFHPDLSGRDNVYLNASILGLSKEETAAQFDSIVAFSEIGEFIDTQVKFYSSGMYVRLAFSVAVHTQPDVLLVDEVLAVGDEAFQRKCMDKIREFQERGCTIVLVSHSSAQVMEVCDRGVVLREGEVAFIGSASEATKAYREILEGKRQKNLAELNQGELGQSKVTGIRVLNNHGEPLAAMEPGSDIVIQITVQHQEPQDEWYTSFSIDTPTAQQVYGTGIQRLTSGPHAAVDAGEMTVEYAVSGLGLAGGRYLLNADVLDESYSRMDVLWQGAILEVAEDPRQTGTVHAVARPI